MICFEVTINGEKMCRAGVEDYGVISAIFSYVKARPQANTENTNNRDSDEPNLHVGGLVNDTHLDWLDGILEVGDEVTIRVIEADHADAPVREHKQDAEELKRQRRNFYEKCKLEFENEDTGSVNDPF